MKPLTLAPLRVACLAAAVVVPACGAPSSPRPPAVPAAIQAVFDEPLYANATWGLRVVDVATGEVPIDLEPGRAFYIGSVRKVFTVSELLSAVGPDHHYDTPVYRRGVAYLLVVNDVALEGLDDLIEVFQDEGRISAILWRDY